MLLRDVNNMTRYYAQFAPVLSLSRYGEEMWSLYEEGLLKPETELSGLYDGDADSANVDSVLEEIKAVMLEERERQERLREAEDA